MNPIRRQATVFIARLDRRLLAIAGLLAVLAVSEILLHSRHVDYRTRYEQARQDLILLQGNQNLLGQVASDRSGSDKPRDSLLSLTNRLLEQHELRSSSITPNNDGSMTLSFDATEYVRLMAWLHAAEGQRIRIVDIGILQTDTPGLVTARLSLSR